MCRFCNVTHFTSLASLQYKLNLNTFFHSWFIPNPFNVWNTPRSADYCCKDLAMRFRISRPTAGLSGCLETHLNHYVGVEPTNGYHSGHNPTPPRLVSHVLVGKQPKGSWSRQHCSFRNIARSWHLVTRISKTSIPPHICKVQCKWSTVVPWFASIIRSENVLIIQSTRISKRISP
jgi:hypothetical protein